MCVSVSVSGFLFLSNTEEKNPIMICEYLLKEGVSGIVFVYYFTTHNVLKKKMQ